MTPREGVVEHLVVVFAGVHGASVVEPGGWYVRGGELYDKLRRLAVPVTTVRPAEPAYQLTVVHGFPDPIVHVCTDGERGAWQRASSGVTKAALSWYAGAMMATKAEAGADGQARLAEHMVQNLAQRLDDD